MLRAIKSYLIGLLVLCVLVTPVFAVTIYQTVTTDSVNTFRTNVNSSLVNLQNAFDNASSGFNGLYITSTGATFTGNVSSSGLGTFANLLVSGRATTTNLTISGITGSTQCLHVDTNGVVTGTGVDCGTGSGAGSGDIVATGTANYFPYFLSSKILSGTSTIYFASERVGINTTSPSTTLHVVGSTTLATTTATKLSIATTTYDTNTEFKVAGTSTLYGRLLVKPRTQQGDGFAWPSNEGAVHVDLSNVTGTALMVEKTDTNGSLDNGDGPLIWIKVSSTQFDNPIMRIISTATSSQAPIRLDSPAPEIEMVETDQTAPAGKYEIRVQNDRFAIDGRAAADNTFERIITFQRLAQGGSVAIVEGADIDPEEARLEILNTSSTFKAFMVSTSTTFRGHVFTIATSTIGIGTPNPSSNFRLNINNNGLSPTTPDMFNSVMVGTGASGANAANKYLGQIGFNSCDDGFGTCKAVAYLQGEAAETYAADIDAAAQLNFYTGGTNSTSAIERATIDENGYLGLGIHDPTSYLHVVGASGGSVININSSSTAPAYITGGRNNAATWYLGQSDAGTLYPGASGEANNMTLLRSNGSLQLQVNGSTDVGVIYMASSTYYVGINTRNPSSTLHVYGDARIRTNLTVDGLANGGVLYPDSNGLLTSSSTAFRFLESTTRLGIGTSTPATTLHVVGGITGKAGSTATTTIKVGGTLAYNITNSGNVAGEATTTLHNISIASGTFVNSGDSVEFMAGGSMGNTSNADKRITITFGTSSIFDSGLLTSQNASWSIRGSCIRNTQTSERCNVSYIDGAGFLRASTTNAGFDANVNNEFIITGGGTSGSDVLLTMTKLWWSPAP